MHVDAQDLKIKSVAVIGAGVMGATIAAHVANAGVNVLLLDIVPEGATDRSIIARTAIETLKKMDPAPLMGSRAIRLLTPGNTEDDFDALAGCDWIIEAVSERLDIKQSLYRRLQDIRKPGAVVSSNTSTIPLRDLTAGLPEAFTRAFCITHFFNPPRYMRLLEIVASPGNNIAAIETFADVMLGKTVIHCKDTPGFIANRIGSYWIQTATTIAEDMGLTIEEADAAMGKPLGFPATGVFGLMDLVGLDLGAHVSASLARLLPQTDPFHAVNRHGGVMQMMIAQGYTGKKGKGGFYRDNRGADGKRQKTVLDLGAAAAGALAWRAATKPEIPELKAARKDLKKLLAADTKIGRYAWAVLGRVLAYAASLVPEIAETVADVDAAMRLGYMWREGPFELIDRLGAAWVAAHLPVPVPELLRQIGDGKFYREVGPSLQQYGPDGHYHAIRHAPGSLYLADIKRATKPLLSNNSASAWDLGDGVVCFELHAEIRGSMLNMLDGDVFSALEKTLALVGKQYKALVIYNDDPRIPAQNMNFSTGANIGLASMMATIRLWSKIENSVRDGQKALLAMRDAPFPVVAATAGRALGGGCEMVLHSNAVQAHAESYIGLVEAGVGLVPAWGGCTEMLTRWSQDKQMPKGPMPAVIKVFEIISTATLARSAAEAMELKFLRPTDGITPNRNRLLADAKARALEMAKDYRPSVAIPLHLPGPAGRITLATAVDGFHRAGRATKHDVTVSLALAEVLTGGDTDALDEMSETDVMALERQQIMKLFRTKETQARLKSIIDTGKPLRN